MRGEPVVSEDRLTKARKHGRRSWDGYVDLPMLICLSAILIFGLAMIYSTSSYRAMDLYGDDTVSYTHLTLPTNREV